MLTPDYIFETSWEVCNKVGGIYAVLSTRAASMQQLCKDKVFFIGPDLSEQNTPFFKESKSILKAWRTEAAQAGISVRVGRWLVPGNPIAILVDYRPFFSLKNDLYRQAWEKFSVNSIAAYGDYDESAVFGFATGKVMESLYRYLHLEDKQVAAHFNEWMTAFGLFYVREHLPEVGTLFTTHATSIGRSIAGNQKPLYDYFEGYHGDQMAQELNMVSKHSVEKQAAHHAHCFTTVSDLTNRECRQLLDKAADVVTPNGFESEFVPKSKTIFNQKREQARQLLRRVASQVVGGPIADNSLLVGISGRYEWKNKGIDAFIAALARLNQCAKQPPVIAFLMIPAWQQGAWQQLPADDRCTTHQLCDPNSDPVLGSMKYYGLNNTPSDRVKVVFVPSYLTGQDGVFGLPYYDLLIGLDLTVFPSYYEPWGYTPHESIAFHVPTITTDLAGFGLWAQEKQKQQTGDLFSAQPIRSAVVVHRSDSNWDEAIRQIAEAIDAFAQSSPSMQEEVRSNAAKLAEKADWRHFFQYYLEAYDYALRQVNKA